jgi:hypothetical protein
VVPSLALCSESPPYLAVIVGGPAPVRRALNFTEQDVEGPLAGASTQCRAFPKDAEPLLENETLPVGASGGLPVVSVTVAVHFAARRRLTLAGEHFTTVLVESFRAV